VSNSPGITHNIPQYGIMKHSTILSLCDYTGNWSRPYEQAGYQVVRVDIQNGVDARLSEWIDGPVHGILAAPPCTEFSSAGAHLWKRKGVEPLLHGLSIVDACLRAVAIYRPTWWALENPVGRLRRWIGPPAWSFQPHQFGDPYTKRTYLWGNFCPPTPLFSNQARKAVAPAPMVGRPGCRDRTTLLGSRGKAERSATPLGFSQAFFEVNP
jgi:hypothetical protein